MVSQSIIKKVAQEEKVSISFLESQISKGRLVIPMNRNHDFKKIIAIGQGVRIKVNTNIGVSQKNSSITEELNKLDTAIKSGTDTVMDLSIGENISDIRSRIIKSSSVPVGTVPLYEIADKVIKNKGDINKMNFDDVWDILKVQAQAGVDFFTIHSGVLRNIIPYLKKGKRLTGVVSRGGAIITRWMYANKKENLFYQHFDSILDLAKRYNIILSLGDGLRPGSLADSSDDLQLSELFVLGHLVKRCLKKGVQVMVEGPGHIRLDEIAANMQLAKAICHNVPFYVLGPLPLDIAAGYDHIASSIGSAIAGLNGADFLCVVTPAEHLRLPSLDDIKQGVIASRISAHTVNLLKSNQEEARDYQLSYYRAKRNWSKMQNLVIDRDRFIEYRKEEAANKKNCSMCGEFCSMNLLEECGLL